MFGTFISVMSVSAMAMVRHAELPNLNSNSHFSFLHSCSLPGLLWLQGNHWMTGVAWFGVMQALVPALLMNICIVGINQIFDVAIDKVSTIAPSALSLDRQKNLLSICAAREHLHDSIHKDSTAH